MPIEGGESVEDEAHAARLDHAIRLFEYLKRIQQIKSKPVRNIDSYENGGEVMWLHSLPEDPSISSAYRFGNIEPGEPILTIDRVRHDPPPPPPEDVAPWLSGGFADPLTEPSLAEMRTVYREVVGEPSEKPAGEEAVALHLSDDPSVSTNYREWMSMWIRWASDERRLGPIREVYGQLFSAQMAAASHPDELELICGLGCLAWKPGGHEPVRRHAFVTPVSVDLDDTTGTLIVNAVESADTLRMELDMLDPVVVTDPARINLIRERASELEAHPLDRDQATELSRRLVHALDPDGQYLDEDAKPPIGDFPVISIAPAVILRKRSKQGLLEVFEQIVAQIKAAGIVPEGLLPLVDPNHRPDPGLAWDGTDGAVVDIDGEAFLPMPVNDRQLQVITKVDKSAQTLVQGPPGTGKTHTAAALITHLLAQGKRVLVTAQTDQALKEIRAKLPEAIRPLSVAVVGTGREDMADLKVAVERIAQAAEEHDPTAAARNIANLLDEIDGLRRERAASFRLLLKAREGEVEKHDLAGAQGSLAAIAAEFDRLKDSYGWIDTLVDIGMGSRVPLLNREVGEWLQLLNDGAIQRDEADSTGAFPQLESLPTPDQFGVLATAESTSKARRDSFSDVEANETFQSLHSLSNESRAALRAGFTWIADEVSALLLHTEPWARSAVADVQNRRSTPWRARQGQVKSLIDLATPLVEWLGPIERIRCSTSPALMLPMARGLRVYLQGGGSVKVDPAGRPKVGSMSNRVVKEARPFFASVTVDTVPPTSVEALDRFLTWANALEALESLDQAWPINVKIPAEDTLSERLYWHVAELELLDRVLIVANQLERMDQALAESGIRNFDWTDMNGLRHHTRVVDAIVEEEKLSASRAPIEVVLAAVETLAHQRDSAPCNEALVSAIKARDVKAYGRSWDRVDVLWKVRRLILRRDELSTTLTGLAPRLVTAVTSLPEDGRWAVWLPVFEEAWKWSAIGAWIRQREVADVNLVGHQLDATEDHIRVKVEQLSGIRAWKYAVSADRMSGEARANLINYAQLVQKLGKGTSKYIATKRADVKVAMDRCRPSVPVWVMPIYRIAEQIRIAPDLFDVVIVDEASQAGLDATFLQYLAPKMVVIGDDKQVSPAAVGVDQQQLMDLANQYLYDDPYKASWQNPQRSLFDEAKMRYGGMTTLIEHRRCVPEIIGFSNRVAYEPENIRLIPVRQFGADRLEPIRPVFMADGYSSGGTNKTNPVECDSIVDQIEKCLADPAYDGMTFGVISLQGPTQALLIEKALLDRIPPEEWSARDLRCGDSAAFQGSERNVMFLSMVAAPEEGKRTIALTADMYLQRYNVAASRARDQMWLFHSVALTDLVNTEDLRFQLLDYCYGTVNRSEQSDPTFQNPVPEDVHVAPFDSLFEQRVFNRLIDRGYTVIPQFPTEGFKIDLVILGKKTKVAIECDGDYWHGPDRYEADLARKRDLERNGWRFFNLLESTFNINQAKALTPLWDMLDELEVHPSGWVPPVVADPAPPVGQSPLYETAEPVQAKGELDLPAEVTTPAPSVKLPGARPLASEHLEVAPSELDTTNQPVGDQPKAAKSVSTEVHTLCGESLSEEASKEPAGTAMRVASLARYEAFAGVTTPALEATQPMLVDEIVSIVAAEGPVLGERIHQVHVRASGGQRVGRQIASALNGAVSSSVRHGFLVEEGPLLVGGIKGHTYRLPSQPRTADRELGPRTLEQVPPGELASVMASIEATTPGLDESSVFRQLLDGYGLRRMTINAISHLRRTRGLTGDSSIPARADDSHLAPPDRYLETTREYLDKCGWDAKVGVIAKTMRADGVAVGYWLNPCLNFLTGSEYSVSRTQLPKEFQ